jgi:protein-S-isoprenylcysteine O-methyltransferase Ste14
MVFHVTGEWLGGRESASVLHASSAGLLTLLGAVVFASGFLAYLCCAAWLMSCGRGPYIEFDPPQRLVLSGPYRWVRNPIVLAVLATIAGEALYFQSAGNWFLCL